MRLRFRLDARFVAAITLGVVVAASGLVHGQGGSGGRFVAIGCLTNQGTAAAPRYVITDTRGGARATYRLTGDTPLAPHVGHRVEVAGPLVSGPGPTTLKVQSLVWLASTCTSK